MQNIDSTNFLVMNSGLHAYQLTTLAPTYSPNLVKLIFSVCPLILIF